jgi:hypothetical protein
LSDSDSDPNSDSEEKFFLKHVDDKVRRFFWGLGLESQWDYALPLANAILRVFGVGDEEEDGWEEWKEGALKRAWGR